MHKAIGMRHLKKVGLAGCKLKEQRLGISLEVIDLTCTIRKDNFPKFKVFESIADTANVSKISTYLNKEPQIPIKRT